LYALHKRPHSSLIQIRGVLQRFRHAPFAH
jgi:hypothetical protein